jgi:hypothetical protein
MACYGALHNSLPIFIASRIAWLVRAIKLERSKSLQAHDFDKRRWLDLTWVRYLRMTLWADPPRAKVIVASARAVVFSVTMRNASDWALGPPAKSFIILKCITCCVSIPSIAASPAIFIQCVNTMYPFADYWSMEDNLSQHCSFHAATEMRQSTASVRVLGMSASGT